MLTAIRQWVIKTMMKGETGIVKTLPKKDLVEFNVQMTAERLARNGIDPNVLKNVNQVENAINRIENRPPVQQGIRSTKSAKVMDMEGNEIKDPKDIIGGKAVKNESGSLMSVEETLKNMIMAENKKNIAAMKNRKMVKDAVDNASPGFVKGDRKYNAQLVADDLADKKFGKDFSDLDQKQQMDLYNEALDGLDNSDKFAQGGRAGFSKGSGLKTLFNFLNENNPMQAYKKYLKSVENRMKAGKELEVAGEVVPVAAGGALITNQMKKVLKKMNEEQKKRIEQEAQEELRKDMEKKAEGGRAGFKTGLGKGFLEFISKQLKPRGKVKFDEDRFRTGPIDLDFLENIDKKDLAKFIRTRDTGGIGGYGMYDKFADMPAGLRAAELIKTIKTTDGGINYKAAELFLGKRLKGNESVDELIQMLNRQEMRAEGGRIGYADGTPSFEEYMQERRGMEKKQNFERLYKEYLEDLRRKDVMKQKQEAKDGGRIGFKDGMTRRSFLKLLGGLASLPIIGKFLKPAKVASKAADTAAVVSKSTPPAYFFELAETIKKFGKSDKVTYQDRVEIHRYTGKNGDDYELIEDLSTGDMKITKDKTGIGTYGDKSYDTINDRSVMEYRKGRGDETTKGTPPDEYDEYKVEFDMDGTEGDADNMSEFIRKEIIEETKDNAPSIKKASGGIARMLGE